MEVFNFLSRVKDTCTTDEFAMLLHQLGTHRFSLPMSQVTSQLKVLFRHPARLPLQPEFDSMINKALADPVYEATVTGVATQFGLLRQVQLQWPRSEFSHFVDCFGFGTGIDATAIQSNMTQLKQRVAPVLRARLERILEQQGEASTELLIADDGMDMLENDGLEDIEEDGMMATQQQQEVQPTTVIQPPPNTPITVSQLQQRQRLQIQQLQQHQQEQNAPSSSISTTETILDPQMQRLIQHAYHALGDNEQLCRQFMGVLDFDQMNGIPFSDSIVNIYQWVQNVNPALWDSLSMVLEEMQTLQDTSSNQYESYEDFVQRNFLDNGGQEQLDQEIEQARVQHLFSNLSM